MRWCQPHWDELRVEVERQGLAGFVATDGETMAQNLQRQMAGELTLDTFDPLFGAMIGMQHWLDTTYGMASMLVDGCPICFADRQHQNACEDRRHGSPCAISFSVYFPNAVGDQLAIYQELSA